MYNNNNNKRYEKQLKIIVALMSVAPKIVLLTTNFPLSIWAMAFKIMGLSVSDLGHNKSSKPHPQRQHPPTKRK
jgi:flagellar biosynthesis protein FliP